MTTTPNLTPQQRWQAFRTRLPVIRWFHILGLILALLLFTVIVLPYLLPLSGPSPVPAEELTDPNGGFIEVDGVNLYYTHQPGEGEAVLLIHGFGGSTVDWRALSLSDYDVYAVDLPGFGLSEKGLDIDMTHPALADLLVSFLDAVGVEQAHIVGHDMGGNIAVHVAQRHPDQTRSLTLIAAAMQYASSGGVPESVLKIGFINRWARVVTRWVLPTSTEIDLRSAMAQEAAIDDALVQDYGRVYRTADWDLSILALGRDSGGNALPERLQDMNVPTLILWGQADSWINPATAEQLENDIPGAQRVMLPHIGHIPMLEAPDATSNALLDFWAN
jgi:pimeloyl-ACP methyl ester carboxylesterase